MRGGRLAHVFGLCSVAVGALALSSGGTQAQIPPHPLKPAAAFSAQQILLAGGQQLRLSGPLGCDADTTVQLQLAVTQQSTAAAVLDQWSGLCTGDPTQQWTKDVAAVSGTTFGPGDAFACGVAIARGEDGTVVAVGQWCDSVELVSEGAD
jgi:hypothetical protein